MTIAHADLRPVPPEADEEPVALTRANDPGRQGDEPSAGALEAQVFSLVYRQMHSLVGRWTEDFDDLVQMAAEQAVRSLGSFRREAELSTWTYRICYRTVLRHRRTVRRWLKRFSLEPVLAEPRDGAPAVSARLEQQERSIRLHRALERLSEKRRAVVVLRELEGMSIGSIAAIVDASEATVRSRLRDARKQLARLLREDAYFGDDACWEKIE